MSTATATATRTTAPRAAPQVAVRRVNAPAPQPIAQAPVVAAAAVRPTPAAGSLQTKPAIPGIPEIKSFLKNPRLNKLLFDVFHNGQGSNHLDGVLENFLKVLREHKEHQRRAGKPVWDDFVTELPVHFTTECCLFVHREHLYLFGPKSTMVPAAPVAPAAAAATKKTTVVLMRVALPRDEDDDDMEDFKGKRLLFVRLFAWTVRPEFFLGDFFGNNHEIQAAPAAAAAAAW